jgi:glycosyltransferase involved in cell wall biosynthesis
MQGETIVCVATRDWDSMWRNNQQIMSRLAAQNRVLYFEPGRTPTEPVLAEMRRNLPNFVRLRPQKLHNNLILIPTPSCLPLARRRLPRAVLRVMVPLVGWINARILIRQIRWAMRRLDVHAPILWLYEPGHAHLIGKFGEKLVCYTNYDEYAHILSNQRIKALVQRSDDQLSRRADVIFATGRAQWERRRKLNPNAHFVPNGVDFDLFHTALDPGTPVPPDIADLPRPVIGYTGWLAHQIDIDLLLRTAEAYAGGSLVLVGPDEMPKDERYHRLRSLPNVHLLGRKPRADLPAYLKAFDVALIPYVLAGYTLTAYPLKLHEYLAAGRAVVSTALPEVRPFEHIVRLAETPDEFIHQIGAALCDDAPEAFQARVDVARQNTWDQRVAEIYRILEPFVRES